MDSVKNKNKFSIEDVYKMIINNDFNKLKNGLKEKLISRDLADKDNLSPLHFSVELGNESITKLLIENGFNVNCMTFSNEFSPLHIAVRDNHIGLVKYLLNHGAKINCKNYLDYAPLHLAVNAKNIAMVRLLLQHGADPNVITKDRRKETPLLKAATISYDLTKLLLENGAILSNDCREVDVSILANKPEVTKLLLTRIQGQARLKPNRIGRSPLQNFVSHISNIDAFEALNMMNRLIELGDDINYANHFGSLFHILITRCAFAQYVDSIAVELFDYLLSIPGRNCDQYIHSGHGTPLCLAFKLNIALFAVKLIQEGFVNVHRCQLDDFRFDYPFILPLKLLYYLGYKFRSTFEFINKPKSNELENVQAFKKFCDWLKSKQGQVLNLKCLVRIFIRDHFKEKTKEIVEKCDLPSSIRTFLLLRDIDSSL